ncbi:MAG: enoyl-CoA hydratase/isomerase family protein, partial [Pseudomonadota bacterium]|nr:enoyl-CoA hydratase/isomerase family protein [Pseudomonadota bacterium]
MPDASATEDLVLYETKDRIATITINRPDKLNALSNGVVAQLRDAMLRLQASDDMCAIVTAAGDRAFSVGADLRDPPRDPQLWECMPGVGVDVDKPLVAAVSGYCVGGAFCLVQFCDFAVASASADFFAPEAQIGFCGGLIAGLAARLPHKVAMEFMLTG